MTLCAAILFAACNSEPDPVLKEAFSVHNKAISVQGEAKIVMAEAQELIGNLQAELDQNEGLSDTMKVAYVGVITQLQAFVPTMENWEENLVEVPGFAHDHDHGHGDEHHHHEHKPIPDHIKAMAPADMLRLQQDFLKQIEGLRDQMRTTLANAKNLI